MTPFAIAITGPRQLALVDEPEAARPLAAGEVRLRTLFSGISAGTELASYRGTSPYLHKRWDGDLRLFVADEASLAYPLVGYGYEEVGEVVEAARDAELAPGTLVYGTWGHRSDVVLAGDQAAWRVLPAGVDTAAGIFSHIGATALNGVLDAAPRLGETVAVFGLGVVGQLVCQLLSRAGARVIAVDLLPGRREMAGRLGVATEHLLDGGAAGVAERIRALTGGRGADVCVEAAGSARALHEAVRACAYASRVVALGFLQGEGRGLYLGEEFHHNRISLVSSQIGGPAPELAHRWDRRRLVQTFMGFVADGSVRTSELITHRVPVRDAAAVFRLLDEGAEDVLQAVLDFREPGSLPSGATDAPPA